MIEWYPIIFVICTTTIVITIVVSGAYVLGKACDVDKEKYKSQEKK